MASRSILWPMIAQVALVAIVWIRMFVVRLGEMGEKRLEPQSIRNSVLGANAFTRVEASDNFKNLFEVPVLFFAVCLALAATSQVTGAQVVLAWIFVASRALHSLIHLTYNQVMHRFYAYAVGTVTVFAMWALFAVSLASAGNP
jgi:hypothetical protein